MPAAQATAPLLHRFLGIGLLLLAVLAGVLKLMGTVPMIPPDAFSVMMSYAFSAIAAVVLAVALFILKPRRLGRRSESRAAYERAIGLARNATERAFLIRKARG